MLDHKNDEANDDGCHQTTKHALSSHRLLNLDCVFDMNHGLLRVLVCLLNIVVDSIENSTLLNDKYGEFFEEHRQIIDRVDECLNFFRLVPLSCVTKIIFFQLLLSLHL